MPTNQLKNDRKFVPLIIGVGVVVPALVAVLFFGEKIDTGGLDLSFLPHLNAMFNGLTAIMLLFGLMAIKNKIVFMHKRFMTAALILSALFLVSYVLYHATHESTPYQGEGFIRYVYFSLLISHIILAIVIVPLVLISYVRALAERFDKHRKIAKITWPIWFYVTVTGVIVYAMIQQYY